MNKNKRYPALFMAPGVLIYGVFFILPVLIGVWYSFTNWNFTRADFVGLMNYKNIISDPSIKRALLNTIIFTVVTTVGKVGLGLALAVFLNRKLHLRNYLRGISFFPAIISTVAVGIVFTAILHPYGLLNQFFRALGLDFMAKNWLTYTKLGFCLSAVWRSGSGRASTWSSSLPGFRPFRRNIRKPQPSTVQTHGSASGALRSR